MTSAGAYVLSAHVLKDRNLLQLDVNLPSAGAAGSGPQLAAVVIHPGPGMAGVSGVRVRALLSRTPMSTCGIGGPRRPCRRPNPQSPAVATGPAGARPHLPGILIASPGSPGLQGRLPAGS